MLLVCHTGTRQMLCGTCFCMSFVFLRVSIFWEIECWNIVWPETTLTYPETCESELHCLYSSQRGHLCTRILVKSRFFIKEAFCIDVIKHQHSLCISPVHIITPVYSKIEESGHFDAPNCPSTRVYDFMEYIWENISPCGFKSSQVTYVTMVPRVGNETLRPLRATMGNASSVTRAWRNIWKNTIRWPATAHDVTTGATTI